MSPDLANLLEDAAPDPVGLPTTEETWAAGRSRRRVRWLAAAAASVATLAVFVLGGVALTDSPAPSPDIVDQPGDGAAPDAAPVTWSWEQVEWPTTEPTQILSDGERFHIVEEQPSAAVRIWSSADGRRWDLVHDGPLGFGPASPSHDAVGLSRASSGRVLLAGGDATVARMPAAMVDADGDVRTAELPVPLAESQAWSFRGEGPGDSITVQDVVGAIGQQGALVVPVLRVDRDWLGQTVFGDEYTSESGVDLDGEEVVLQVVIGEGPEVRMGLEQVPVRAEDLVTGTEIWVSPDGENWTSAPATGPFAVADRDEPSRVLEGLAVADIEVVGTDDGFVALALGGTGLEPLDYALWHSTDGVNWALVADGIRPGTLLEWRGQALLHDERSVLRRLTAEGLERLEISQWQVPLKPPGDERVAAGDAGIVRFVPNTHELGFSPDGEAWQRVQLPAAMASLEGFAWGPEFPEVLAVGRDTVVVVDQEGQLWVGTPE